MAQPGHLVQLLGVFCEMLHPVRSREGLWQHHQLGALARGPTDQLSRARQVVRAIRRHLELDHRRSEGHHGSEADAS